MFYFGLFATTLPYIVLGVFYCIFLCIWVISAFFTQHEKINNYCIETQSDPFKKLIFINQKHEDIIQYTTFYYTPKVNSFPANLSNQAPSSKFVSHHIIKIISNINCIILNTDYTIVPQRAPPYTMSYQTNYCIIYA